MKIERQVSNVFTAMEIHLNMVINVNEKYFEYNLKL